MTRGDQIYVYRELFNLQEVYEHHGIDCGDSTVIHYRKPSETIERTSLLTFSRRNQIYVREYHHEFCFIPDVVIGRAANRLGEKKYNFLFNNCEHFATWCKTGISYSVQIENFIPFIKKINVDQLYKPLKQAFKEADSKNTQQLLQEALEKIRIVWDKIQPQYKEMIAERDSWNKVAKEALKRNRDDLARAALEKKLTYQQKIDGLKKQLDQLAMMTEKVLIDLMD